MLKTAALVTIAMSLFGASASAMETPKYDRKIERAAMIQVARKMGGLRETLGVEFKLVLMDNAGTNVALDMAPTAGILAQPNEPRFPVAREPVNFRVIAGNYFR